MQSRRGLVLVILMLATVSLATAQIPSGYRHSIELATLRAHEPSGE